MHLPQWIRGSRLRRSISLWASALAILLAAGVPLYFGVVLWVRSQHSRDLTIPLAKIGDLLALGTLILALTAGIVALMAYIAATGSPDLRVRLTIDGQQNEASFDVSGEGASIPPGRAVNILIRNLSKYSARNPAIGVRFDGMARRWGEAGVSSGWEFTDFLPSGDVIEMQWDGGPTYSVHGISKRHLPALYLNGLYYDRNRGIPGLHLELLAEGYERPLDVPVTFITPTETWPDHPPKRRRSRPKGWL